MDFDDFVGAQQASLLRTAVTLMGGDLHSAEDLVQTALARCWLRWRRIGRMDYPMRTRNVSSTRCSSAR